MSVFDHRADDIIQFDTLLDKASELDAHEAQKEIIETAIRLGEIFVERYPNDPDAHQMLGLAGASTVDRP